MTASRSPVYFSERPLLVPLSTVSTLDFRKKTKLSFLPSTKEAREFELTITLAPCAERVVHQIVTEEQKFEMGDRVLLRRGNQLKGSKFKARMRPGLYKVRTGQHPRYELENAPGRRYQKPVHVRRLRLYMQRENEHLKISNKPIRG